jgi:putative peptidoglycan lipid II flippase
MILGFLRPTGQDSINKQILRAALIVGAFSIVARGAAVIKELIVARTFGRSDALDAFLIAFLLPAFVVTIVSGTVGSALIPVFVQVQQKQGREAAEKLLSSMALISAATLGAMALLLGLFAPYYLPYVAHGFSSDKLRLTRELLYMLLPWIVFSGTAQFITYVLNAGEKFALPALVPLVTPLVVIGAIMLAARTWGPFALSAGSVAGGMLETALLVGMLNAHGVRLRSWWGGFDEPVRTVLAQCGPLIAGAVLMASTPVVNQSVAAMLPAGSVSALGYANRIIGGITALGAVALSTATLPYFSRMAAQSDWAGCRHTLKRYSALLVATTIPFTLLLMAFSRPLIRLLYQRGAFTAADTELVGKVQAFYAIQIPFLMLCALLVRFLSAIRRNDLLMYGSAINVAVNIVLSFTFMKIWGVSGIALSASLVYAVSFAFLTICTLIILARQRSQLPGATPAGQAGS